MPPCCAGDECRLKTAPVDGPRVCPVCDQPIHGVLCGVQNGDNRKVKHAVTCHKCVQEHGGEAYTRRQWEASRRTKSTASTSESVAAPKRRTRATAATTITTPSPTTTPKRKRPRKSPTSTKTLTKESWYRICSLYVHRHSDMSRAAFLRDPISGLEVSGTLSDQQVFGRKLKEFAAGTLQPTSNKRHSDGQYPEVEQKIVQYVQLKLQRHQKEKLGITWAGLCLKAKEFAEAETDPKYKDFAASSGWMQRLMKRNGITNVNSPWAIQTLQSAEEAMQELKSFATAKGLKPEELDLLVQFGQKLRQRVVVQGE